MRPMSTLYKDFLMIISVDHGNSAIKTCNYIFASALNKHAAKPPLAGDILEYDGSYWSLSGQRIPYMMDKTSDENFFVLTLFAIAKELLHNGNVSPHMEVELAVGLPPEHFTIMKSKFAEYFRRGGVRIAYNGTTILLTINRVFVYPQAYAAVAPQADSLLNTPRMFIIDIGGYTTDLLLLKNGRPDLEFCRSFETGVITMCNDVIGKVNSQHGIKLVEDQITAVLQGDTNLYLMDDVINTIRTMAREHLKRIIDGLRENMVELKANPAIFIGGGSILFKQYIENSPMIAKADFILEPKANAIGYKMLASYQVSSSSE